VGIAGSVVAAGVGEAVACRSDERFAQAIAAGTGYVPNTMLVMPLKRGDEPPIGAISFLDRRDGGLYGPADMERAALFADLAVAAIDVEPMAFTSLGETRIR
jgi:hypothetical protein